MQDFLTRIVPEFVVLDAFAQQRIRDRDSSKDQEHCAEEPQHQAEGLVGIQPGEKAFIHAAFTLRGAARGGRCICQSVLCS